MVRVALDALVAHAAELASNSASIHPAASIHESLMAEPLHGRILLTDFEASVQIRSIVLRTLPEKSLPENDMPTLYTRRTS